MRISAVIPLLIALAFLAIATACGRSSSSSSSASSEFVHVVNSEGVYRLSDVEAIGYKVSKAYDVERLQGATAAYYGFWRPPFDSEPVDYEVRIYPSHVTAVEIGTRQAVPRTGTGAILRS